METKAPFERGISLLRFPMMVGIVIIHCYIGSLADTGNSAIVSCSPADDVMLFFSEIFCRIFVPMFFFISGYLFFYKKDVSKPGFYLSQWRSRIHTLLIPYLLWNIYALVIVLIKCYGPVSYLFPRMAADPVSMVECLEAFWAFRPVEVISVYEPASAPVDIPLWFVRDLMVIALLAPLFYKLLKPRWGVIFPIALLVLFVAGIWFPHSSGCSLTAATFFICGCWFSIRRLDPLSALRRIAPYKSIMILSALIYAAAAYAELARIHTGNAIALHGGTIVIGMVMLLATIGYIATTTRCVIPATLTESAFFIYGFHLPMLLLVIPLIGKFASISTNGTWLFYYFSLIVGTIIVSVVLFRLCRAISPRFTSLLVGGRKKHIL